MIYIVLLLILILYLYGGKKDDPSIIPALEEFTKCECCNYRIIPARLNPNCNERICFYCRTILNNRPEGTLALMTKELIDSGEKDET